MSDTIFIAWNTIAICLIALGALYFIRKYINRFIVQRYISSSITFSIHKRFEAERQNIRILMLGTCEFRSGIDARLVAPDAFNFSVPRVSFVELAYYLNRYIDDMRSLKLVILSVHPNSFCANSATATVAPMLFMKYMDLGELLSLSSPSAWPSLLWHKIFYGSGMAKIKGGAEVVTRSLKSSIEQRKSAGQRDALKAAAESAAKTDVTDEDALAGVKKHYSHPMFDRRAVVYFEKILNLCRSKNIPVATVCMPSSRYSQKHIRDLGYATDAGIVQTIVNNPAYKGLIAAHLNYTDLFGDNNGYFQFDGWELNREGGRALSLRLAEDITKIMDGR